MSNLKDIQFQPPSAIPPLVRGVSRIDVSGDPLSVDEIVAILIALPYRESLHLTFETDKESEEMGLSVDARRGQVRKEARQDIRLGIRGKDLNHWKEPDYAV